MMLKVGMIEKRVERVGFEEGEKARAKAPAAGIYGPARSGEMVRWLVCRLEAFGRLLVDDVGGKSVWAQGVCTITVGRTAS